IISLFLTNLHPDVARLSADLNWATVLEAEKDEEIHHLKATPLDAGFERGLSMHQTKDEFATVLKKMANFMPGAHDSYQYGNPLREDPKPFAVKPSMKLGQRRETTPPPGFLTPLHIPNINTTERPPVTTTMFTATTSGNTPFAYRASTLTDPAPMISPTFVEANYEILESLLRDRRRQIRNEDLRTEFEYFSEDYDDELEMEPRPERTREVTPPLRTRSPRVHRQRERVVGFEEALNRERSRIGRYIEGNEPSKAGAEENGRRKINLPHSWQPT
ncbi:hypothetical protein Tco_1382242, partial [Tanacetum coccineum]